MTKYLLILFWFLFVEVAFAGRGIDADFIKSTDHTKTWNQPAASGTYATLANSETLTNKTISGLLNTITNIDLTSAVTGTLPIANGGTGQTTAANAINALLPSQTSNSGKFLTTNGSVASWATVTAGGSGDVVGPSSSVDSEISLFSGTTGKLIKRATGTGFVKVSSGVMQTPSSTVSLTTEVSGALPIANGGTGQTAKAAAFDALSPNTTKGDITVFGTTNARLPVGVDGTVLTADSTQSSGVKWSAATGGMSNPMTTGGDLIYGGSSGTPTRLANGAAGQLLQSNGGTSAPSWINLNGILTKGVSYTASATDDTILFTGNGTLSLPAASTVQYHKYNVVTTGNAVVTIDPNGTELICGSQTIKLDGATGYSDSIQMQSDGSNWYVLNGGCERNETFRIQTACTSGTCSINSQSGNWVSSVTWNSTGSYAVAFNSGIFSLPPQCIAESESGSATGHYISGAASTSAVTFQFFLPSTLAAANAAFVVRCQGPR